MRRVRRTLLAGCVLVAACAGGGAVSTTAAPSGTTTTPDGGGPVWPEDPGVAGAPELAVGPDGELLVAFLASRPGSGGAGVHFGDGRTLAGGPESTAIFFVRCADRACRALTTAGSVEVPAWSETLVAAVGPEGNPRFAVWAWGSDFQDDGGTWAIECLDPECGESVATRLAGESPGPVRVAFDGAGDPAAVLVADPAGNPISEGDEGRLALVRVGDTLPVGLPPTPDWPYPVLAAGPDDLAAVVLWWDTPNRVTLMLGVCAGGQCVPVPVEPAPLELCLPFDAVTARFGPDGEVGVPYLVWPEGDPRCLGPRAGQWSGDLRLAVCTAPGCEDMSVTTLASIPGVLELLGAGPTPGGGSVVGWLECAEPGNGPAGCPLRLAAAWCEAGGCAEPARLDVGVSLEYHRLVAMAVAPDGTASFAWRSDDGVHLAACDGPRCGELSERAVLP